MSSKQLNLNPVILSHIHSYINQAGSIFMPIPQLRKQRLREAMQLSPGGTAGEQGLARAVLSASKQGGRTRAPQGPPR